MDSIKRSPLVYYGGKYFLSKKILPLIPKHRIYVEVFGGSAALLFSKIPSEIEVYNDINSNVVNFFRVLRDPEKMAKLQFLLSLTPYSREEFYNSKDKLKICQDDIERAYYFFIVNRMSFSGYNQTWSYTITKSGRGMSEVISRYLSVIDLLPEFCNRLKRVQIDNDDFRKIIKKYDTENTFFYLDPPYLPETRKGGEYQYEMTKQDHEDLLDLLLNIKGKAILSGYDNELYKQLEIAKWTKLSYQTFLWASSVKNKKRDKRLECLWLNYENQNLF